jgi:hypothetical protein
MKVDCKALGLACGILWAVGYVGLAVLTMTNGYGSEFIDMLSRYYLGSGATQKGIVIGAVWSFADAGIGGFILGWLYNKLAK